MAHEGDGKLDSWKAIAEFLGRDVRTVQRWETTEGMPVHRRTHIKRASVWAFESELAKWLEERKDLKAPTETISAELVPAEVPAAVVPRIDLRRSRWMVLGILLSVVCAVILWGVRWHPPSVQTLRLGRLFAQGTQEGGRTERIAVGKAPFQVAITPDGSELYISNLGDGTVSVIQQSTRKVTHTVRVASQPGPLVISPDGRKVYVGSRISGLSIIDAGTKAVTAISTGGPSQSLAITPDGARLFIAMAYKGMERLSVNTGEIKSIPVVGCPYELAIDPEGKRLYVSCRCGGPGGRVGWDAIDVMDLEREVSVGTVNGLPLVGGPIAVSPDNSQVWVSGSDRCFSTNYDHAGCPITPGGLFHVIRALDLKHLAALGLPILTQGQPSFYPDGSRVILVGSDLAEVRDTANFTVLENLENITLRGNVAFSPDGRTGYVAQNSPDGVRVLEPEPVDCEPLRFGLYHLWAMDGNVNDTEGQNHGKAKGGFRFVPGRRGQALHLDGTGRIELSSSRGFLNWNRNWSLLEWTLAAWVKPFTTDTETVVIAARAKDYSWTLGRSETGHWRFQIASYTLESKAKAHLSRWHHLAVVHSQGRLSLYVDGVNESNLTLADLSQSPGISAAIGADPRGERLFRGLIDEVRIHQAALPEPTLRSLARSDHAVCEVVPILSN